MIKEQLKKVVLFLFVFENPWLCQGFRKSFSDEKKTPLAESAATNSTAKQKENIQKECY